MLKKLTIKITVALLAISFTTDVEARRPVILRDGFVLTGIDGNLINSDNDNRWFFEFNSEITDGNGRLKAGTSVEVLPSAALEKMVEDAASHTTSNYKLWGRITKYNDKNYIFPIYFLPLSKIKPPQPKAAKTKPQKEAPSINEPNDPLAVPDQIVAKLESRRIIRTEQLGKGLQLEQDSILIDRSGFIKNDSHGKAVFVFDALGRGVQKISLQLLPSQTLQRAQQKQAVELEPVRFNAAGIVTKYKGDYYLLLQRARRIFSHGNFPR